MKKKTVKAAKPVKKVKKVSNKDTNKVSKPEPQPERKGIFHGESTMSAVRRMLKEGKTNEKIIDVMTDFYLERRKNVDPDTVRRETRQGTMYRIKCPERDLS